MSFRVKINGEWCDDWEPIQAHIMDMEKKIDQQAAEIERLKEALRANVRRCSYYDGQKQCNKIGIHMTDDYDAFTEYRCDEHKGQQCLCQSDSGEFAPSRLAISVLGDENDGE